MVDVQHQQLVSGNWPLQVQNFKVGGLARHTFYHNISFTIGSFTSHRDVAPIGVPINNSAHSLILAVQQMVIYLNVRHFG